MGVYKNDPAPCAWDAALLGCVGATSAPGTVGCDCTCCSSCLWYQPDIDPQRWIKTLPSAQPLQKRFCNASFLFSLQFYAIIVLLSTYTHSIFNHSEAWDNLERKLNIINIYFRVKEIKTQTSDLPRMNYRNLKPTQVFQLQQCPVYRIVSMPKIFFKVYNHN